MGSRVNNILRGRAFTCCLPLTKSKQHPCRNRSRQIRPFDFRALTMLSVAIAAQTQGNLPALKRPVTVADAIQMTMPADPDFNQGADWRCDYAHFSPDGTQFAIVLKQGNLEHNTNQFSLVLYRTAEVLHSPKPNVLVTMSSSSNRSAIGNVRWITNTTLAFLGENPGELPQIYILDTATKHLDKLTNHSNPIIQYDISQNGNTIIYIADPPRENVMDKDQALVRGAVITSPSLYSVLRGEYIVQSFGEQLFVQERGQAPVRLLVEHVVAPFSPPLLSPDGRYALVDGEPLLRNVPALWASYNYGMHDEYVHSFFKSTNGDGTGPFLQRLLIDVQRHSVVPLLDAPVRVGQIPRKGWAADGKSVFMAATYLPLDVADLAERKDREKNIYDVEVKIPSREYHKISAEHFASNSGIKTPVQIRVEDDINTPSKIYSYDPISKKKAVLLDLNPQFVMLSFGKVETIRWMTTNGREYVGGIHFPPNVALGKRYPLVIQTHGYHPDAFTMDGIGEWSSGYAARFLAANGFIVLQSGGPTQTDKALSDGKYTSTQAEKHTEVAAYEGAIDYLDQKGLIDREHVGIMGFSRTVCYVGYALTHSKYHFAAGILVDGIDCGYFQYVTEGGGNADAENLNGGDKPWGKGMATWLEEAPGFSVDKVHTPIRLEAHGKGYGGDSVLEQWEWFSALKTLGKPVDFILLPDADHLLVKPWERIVSQQGSVDWFSFWLKNEENPDPAKAEQYARWRELRKLQEQNARQSQQPNPPSVH